MQTICTASLGSLTYAIKGQKALEEAGISGKIVKLDATKTRRGCSYGIEFPCDKIKRVRSVFGSSHLPVSGYQNGRGGDPL